MSGQKCVRCQKTAYPLESVQVNENRWHKICFKCVTCKVQLNVKTFFYREGGAYCEKCGSARFDKNAQTAETMETKNVKEKPKVSLVNEQFKGELVGQKSSEDATSLHIANRVQAHELATDVNMVNEQVRGELAGHKTAIDAGSISISRPLENSSLIKETKLVNEQIRGAGAGQQSNQVAQAAAVSGV
ncbi:LIM domain containing protein [Acanthamoeba castellanii str. Neff]|uniref:LIM domain containing protein n=1 Tax=Acanthamoeba castellanii (strain ATCC 30010 / Neff) TaxID=1257118 RepID=L8HHC5_ACACF|nr:LIM domain containing protein [Acanthamoeba castellanii str. Neff]ELR23866.1 LIM domain containing protein [Acanthamoeba castellanii str. Neff]